MGKRISKGLLESVKLFKEANKICISTQKEQTKHSKVNLGLVS